MIEAGRVLNYDIFQGKRCVKDLDLFKPPFRAFLYWDEALESLNGTIRYQTIDNLRNLIASWVEEDHFGVWMWFYHFLKPRQVYQEEWLFNV